MYRDYWHLEREPFAPACDPDLFVPVDPHDGALLKLRYLVEQDKAAGVLTADSGTGKTLLTHVLERELGRDRPGAFPVVRVVYPRLEPAELLAQVAVRLGAGPDEVDSTTHGVDRILDRLTEELRHHASTGSAPVIVLDDAHLIEEPAVWRTLRLLLNLRDAAGVRFTLLFVGQPELLGRLKMYPDLDARLGVRTLVPRMTPAQVLSYVRGRMDRAGCRVLEAADPFTAEAYAALADLSGGLPRTVSQLADLTLLLGLADRMERIEAEHVEAAAGELIGAKGD